MLAGAGVLTPRPVRSSRARARGGPPRGCGGAAPASLGTTTKIPSGPPGPADPAQLAQLAADRRRARFYLREVLRDASQVGRVGACGRRRINAERDPEVKLADQEGRRAAHFAGVQLCGRVWLCPVCGPHIRQVRALEVDRGLSRWLSGEVEHGGALVTAPVVMLLTLTVRHSRRDSLAALVGQIKASFTALVSGRAWVDTRADFGLVGFIRAHDTTVGPNGWHPHLHVILLGSRALDVRELRALKRSLYRRWAGTLGRLAGDEARPSYRNGIDLELARSSADVARYVAQVGAGEDAPAIAARVARSAGPLLVETAGAEAVSGEARRARPVALELARGDLKTARTVDGRKHRTPWEVLADLAATGDVADLELWREWERATKGVHALQWSKGLKKLLGVADTTDDEIVAVEVGGEVLYTFDAEAWQAVTMTHGARARVLELAEKKGARAIAAYVAGMRDAWERRGKKETSEARALRAVPRGVRNLWARLELFTDTADNARKARELAAWFTTDAPAEGAHQERARQRDGRTFAEQDEREQVRRDMKREARRGAPVRLLPHR